MKLTRKYKNQKGFTFLEAGIVFIWVLSLAFFGGLLYILWHFCV